MVLASLGSRDEKNGISLTRFSSIEPRTPNSPQSPKDSDGCRVYSLPNDDDDVFADEKDVPKTYDYDKTSSRSSIVPPPPTPGTAPSLEFKKDWRRRKLSPHHVILIVLGVVLVLGLAVGIALAIMFVNTKASTLSQVSPAEAINYNGHLTLSTPWMKDLTDLHVAFVNTVEIILNSSDLNKAFINSSLVHLSNNKTILYFNINFNKLVLEEIVHQNLTRGSIIDIPGPKISDVTLAQIVQIVLRNQVVKLAVSITLPIVSDSIVIIANIPVTSPQNLTTTSTASSTSSSSASSTTTSSISSVPTAPATTEASGLCQQMTFKPCHSLLNTSYFYLPNHFNHSLTLQATDAFSELSRPPLDLTCSRSAVLFLCTLLFPPCEESSVAPIKPCDILCEVVMNECGILSGWPQLCTAFPKENCVEPLPEEPQTSTAVTDTTTDLTSSSTTEGTTVPNTTLPEVSSTNGVMYQCAAVVDFPICTNLGYLETPLPNLYFDCDNIDCLKQQFREFSSLGIESKCTDDYNFFCAYFFPGCDKTSDNFPILPCAEICHDTFNKCQHLLPYPPDCTQFALEASGNCITSIIPENCTVQPYEYCRAEGFTVTGTTSLFGASLAKVVETFEEWALPTIRSKCSANLKFFYCGYFFPKCEHGATAVFPCKSYCEEVNQNCPDAVLPLDCSTLEDWNCTKPKFEKQITATTTTIQPVTTPVKNQSIICQAMNFSLCTKFGYSLTGFPNFWGDSSAEAAFKSYNKFAEPAVSSGCSNNILFFVCTMLFPYCEDGGWFKMPCTSFCEEVNKNCSTLLFYQDCMSVSEPDPNKCFSAPERKECDNADFSCVLINNCVNKAALCNQKNDCGDWSDEWNCECKEEFEVKCKMGMCIPSYQRCDGQFQCPDNSDELNCTCKANQYLCPNEDKCIMPEWLCDGQKDCVSGDDEKDCSSCNSDEFTCFDGKCIPSAQRCDGIPQCKDVSDEMDCIYASDEDNPLGLVVLKYIFHVCGENFNEDHGQTACLKLGESELDELNIMEWTPLRNQLFFQLDSRGNNQSVLGPGKLVDSCSVGFIFVKCKPKACGHPSLTLNSNIINGKEALPGAWPWLVSVKKYNIHECGGAIIHPYFVLTAGHCVDQYLDYDHLSVTTGTNDLLNPGKYSSSYYIRRAILHPEYEKFKKNDIALMELKNPISYNDFVKPVCLPEPKDVFTKRNRCFIAGWGHTLNVKAPADRMQETKITLWDTDKCNGSYMWNGYMAKNERCAGYYNGLIAACSGDSGSPVSCQDETGTFKSIGVISYVYKSCTSVGRPMVFTTTAPYLEWINKLTVSQFTCRNGLQLFDESMLCNTVNDCGDDSDETTPCDVSVNCTFADPFVCGYKTIWKLVSAPLTSIVNNLPLFDHTLGNTNGKFLVSFVKQGDTTSRVLNFKKGNSYCLRFHYHMRGRIGYGLSLTVKDVSTSRYTDVWNVESTTGPDIWQMGLIDFNPGRYEFIFRSYEPQKAALDDIMLLNSSCSQMKCLDGEFKCLTNKNINCLPLAVLCNFVQDCDDGLDEMNCSAPAYWCNFENGNICGLRQSSDDTIITEWVMANSSTTPANLFDHTFGNASGQMFKVDTQKMLEYDTVRMSQNILLLPDELCLRFYYVSTSPASFTVELTFGSEEMPLLKFKNMASMNWALTYATIPSSDPQREATLSYLVQGNELGSGTLHKAILIDDISITRGRCPPFTCPEKMFLCAEESYCIPQEKVCDRVTDCSKFTDEKSCDCTEDEFKCPNEKCLSKSKTCNLVKNCADGSDEGRICDEKRSVSCDFEDPFQCGYVTNTSSNRYRWTRVSGAFSGGAASDHTYLLNSQVKGYYVVADSLQAGSYTALTSIPFESEGSRGLNFYYYAFSSFYQFPGAQTFRLSLVVNYLDSKTQEELWFTNPSSETYWLPGCVMLPRGNISVSFVAKQGSPFEIDFALDDVQLLNGTCDAFLTAGSRIVSFNNVVEEQLLTAASTSGCQETEKACRNGMCLGASLFCDGIRHCPDGSDEFDCSTT